MSLSTNVVRRGSIYYFRTSVPRHLRALVGRDELWRSLRTSQATTARRCGAVLHHLTERLWRDLERVMKLNAERVDRAEVQALIDGWLKAQLDEDAYLREAPDDELFAGVILQTMPEGVADRIVKRIAYEEAAEALEDPFEGLEAGQYVIRNACDLDLRRAELGKIYRDATKRHADEFEDIAEQHVKALFALLGQPIDEFSGKFETATRMMMTAHRDLWGAIEARNATNWRPSLDQDPVSDLVGRLVALSKHPVVASPAPSVLLSGMMISEAAAVAVKAISKRESFGKKRVDDYDVAVRMFIDFLGGDRDFRSVIRKVYSRPYTRRSLLETGRARNGLM